MPADVVAKKLTKHQALEDDMQTVGPNRAGHSGINELDLALANCDPAQRQKAEELVKEILQTNHRQSLLWDFCGGRISWAVVWSRGEWLMS